MGNSGFGNGFTNSLGSDGFGSGFGRPGVFTPTSLGADLALWLDATDTSTLYTDSTESTLSANGAFVGRWKDKSGNNRHADKGNLGGAGRPLRTDGAVNSRTGVNFNAGTVPGLYVPYNVSNPSATRIPGGTKFEIWGVYTSKAGGNYHLFTTYEGAASNYTVMWTANAFGNFVTGHHMGWVDTTGTIRDSGFATTVGPAVVHRGVIDTTLSSGTAKNFINGVAGSPTVGTDTAGGSYSIPTRTWYVGAGQSGQLQSPSSVGEIIYVTRHLTSDEVTKMLNYLKNKWGL